LKIKLKGRHFGTSEVIDAESQAVLNSLTKHDFQDALKERRKHWERFLCAEGDFLRSNGGQ
jgi:hypothetical protein